MTIERYDRQARIPNWKQDKLDNATLVIIGENAFSSYLSVAAAALGIGKIRIISSSVDPFPEQNQVFNLQIGKHPLEGILQKINPLVHLDIYKTPFVINSESYFLEGADFIVNATQRYNAIGISSVYALEKKIPFENVRFYGDAIAGLAGFLSVPHDDKNPQKLEKYRMRSCQQLDDLLAFVAAGAVLEEVKQGMMKEPESNRKLQYEFIINDTASYDIHALVVGAGALGNIVASQLALLNVSKVTIFDPDTIEQVNLNRQIWFYDAVGKPKAEVLAERISEMGNGKYKGYVEKFTRKTKLDKYDLVFDCVDNFNVRLALSESCAERKIPLISGGTNYHSGQVVMQIPKKSICVKHALNLEELAAQHKEQEQEQREGCVYQPDPSVIMSNLVVGTLMVHDMRQLVSQKAYGNPCNGIIKYNAKSPTRFGKIELGDICDH